MKSASGIDPTQELAVLARSRFGLDASSTLRPSGVTWWLTPVETAA